MLTESNIFAVANSAAVVTAVLAIQDDMAERAHPEGFSRSDAEIAADLAVATAADAFWAVDEQIADLLAWAADSIA